MGRLCDAGQPDRFYRGEPCMWPDEFCEATERFETPAEHLTDEGYSRAADNCHCAPVIQLA